ncbi:uncharacterized protein LOC111026807 [Myzus persicae]|uniref:uncharacterized protein LOC111026807 n=1 Tax=Myzus persicae TaxID=13164 RepID=UPI000B938A04|nr:uncharacterized protein LOC111026807 [Myzus persicae]
MVCIAFKSLGHESFHDSHSLIDYKDEKINKSNENDLLYGELKTVVIDYQAVMKKYGVFLTLFGRILLVQIVVLSLTLIVLWFIFIMSFSDVDKYMYSDVAIIKILSAIPPLSIQIYMECYLFGYLHDQKDAIVLALYSSNWTKMDIRCRKMILLTMKMHNAHYQKLKFTRTKIVNLEMFFKTMGDCYTAVSVLIKYIKSMNE